LGLSFGRLRTLRKVFLAAIAMPVVQVLIRLGVLPLP
jgi:hypothetical protein